MRNALILGALLGLLVAVPASAQRADLEFFGGTGPNAVLSRAVKAGNVIYTAGYLGTQAGPGIEEQTHRVMETLRTNLAEAGATMDDVVKCLVFMQDLSERPRMNPIYASYFPNTKPARSAIGVDLGGTARVEIECIAVLPE